MKHAGIEEQDLRANSTLLPAVVIGKHALVGAGSVVTKDVENHTIVVGNPARTINTVDKLPYQVRENK